MPYELPADTSHLLVLREKLPSSPNEQVLPVGLSQRLTQNSSSWAVLGLVAWQVCSSENIILVKNRYQLIHQRRKTSPQM